MAKPTMEIITISGASDSGKTTLIQKLFKYLISDGGEITYYKACGARLDDFNTIVVWKGKIIALCSIGDEADNNNNILEYIKNGIKVATEHHAEILINARTSCIDENEYREHLKKTFDNTFYREICLDKPNSLETLIKNQQIAFKLVMRTLNLIWGN